MAITQKSIKILWSAAAGMCAFPECRERLTYSEAGEFAPYLLGEMAHICGDQPGANRHDSRQTPQERDDYANLILLCPTHHRLVDRVEQTPIAAFRVHARSYELWVADEIAYEGVARFPEAFATLIQETLHAGP